MGGLFAPCSGGDTIRVRPLQDHLCFYTPFIHLAAGVNLAQKPLTTHPISCISRRNVVKCKLWPAAQKNALVPARWAGLGGQIQDSQAGPQQTQGLLPQHKTYPWPPQFQSIGEVIGQNMA